MAVVLASFETPAQATAAALDVLYRAAPTSKELPALARHITLVAPPPRDMQMRLLLGPTLDRPPHLHASAQALVPRLYSGKRLLGPLDAGVRGGLIGIVVTVFAFYGILLGLQATSTDLTFGLIGLFMGAPVTLVGGIIGFLAGARLFGLPTNVSERYEMRLATGNIIVGIRLPLATLNAETIMDELREHGGIHMRVSEGVLRPLMTTAASNDPRTNPLAGNRSEPNDRL